MSTPAATVNGVGAAVLAARSRFFAFATEGFPWIPTAILLGIMIVALFANVITPYNPEVGTLGDRFKPPAWQSGGSSAHLLGTDHLGRDMLSRLIFGTRVSVTVGVIAVVVAGVLGTLL